jgi:hypothetical protein
MAQKPQESHGRVSLSVSTRERPDFTEPMAAFVFDQQGNLVHRAEVRDGKVELAAAAGDLARLRVFVAPVSDALAGRTPTPARLERLGAYEPVLHGPDGLLDRITIPGGVIDRWPFCFCWVRGRVVRAGDNRPVCGARVHVCEVDRIPWWILRLPDPDVFRLRDDLLEIIRNPPIPRPGPFPDPDPGPFPGGPRPGPDPSPISPSLFRFARGAGSLAGSPRPASPLDRVGLNPQPLPPRTLVSDARQAAAMPAAPALAELPAALRSTSSVVVRSALAANWKLIIPWLCWWPHWWWWRVRCDEVATLATDAQGRFETTVVYACGGDRPDLYFWVEYDFGTGFEIVHRPPIACHTHWDYACGTEVTIRVTDPRVPGCGEEPDLPGCQVVVLSIGRTVAVREVQGSGAGQGLTTAGEPFGATLEPRVDFSRTELIEGKKVPYYRWSYRRLTAPDAGPGPVDPTSVPLGATSVMFRDVYRHYRVGTSYLSDRMGPMPTSGPGAAPQPNLFRIRPVLPPAGTEWVVLDERVDLATAYFETASLAGAPVGPGPLPDDLAAGLYELTLELFDDTGALVNWTAKGIDLRIADQDAPFGTGILTTSPAPAHNRIVVGGALMGFRLVVRVDNNRCHADIAAVGGTVTPDPICGFHTYGSPSDTATLSFLARHPNTFATYAFSTTRGPGPTIGAASTSGTAGEAGTAGFAEVADFTYSKDVTVSALLGPCANAAFAEHLDVAATATDGYSRLSIYDRSDNAAFALAVPCPPCECQDGEAGGANAGAGGNRGGAGNAGGGRGQGGPG